MRRRRVMRAQRGFVLVAVLVVVGGALLVASTMMFVAQAEVSSTAGAVGAAQSRALAWSGLRALMVELDAQRDDILLGELPQLEDQYLIYEAGNAAGIVRLMPLGPFEERLVPEASKIDLNAADETTLAGLDLVGPELAQAIIQHRDDLGRPFQSVAELLDVDGVTPELLYGALEDLAASDEATDPAAAEDAALLGAGGIRGIADLVTVWAFEPALQTNGRKRINLNTEWSEELGDRIERRFGAGAVNVVRELMESGVRFDDDTAVCRIMIQFDVDAEEWAEPIDAFTGQDGDYRGGRLDINSAPIETLAAFEEIGPEAAAEMVQVREQLSGEDATTIAWPLLAGILEKEAYGTLASRLTTRSWTYRVRIAAGEVPAEELDAPLSNPVIYEAVIDLSAPTTRVAYLRDVTLLGTAAAIALSADALRPFDPYADDDFDDEPFDREADDDESRLEDDELDPDEDVMDDEAEGDGEGFGPPSFEAPSFDAPEMDGPDGPTEPEFEAPSFEAPTFGGRDEDAEEADETGGGASSSPRDPRLGRWRGGQ